MKRYRGASLTALFLYAALFAIPSFFYGCGSKLPAEHQLISASGGEVKIPVSSVNDGKVHFYTYKKSGKRINFFVRTDGTGRLSAYFDACFTCYKFKKGYRCEGTDLICNECRKRFRLADERWMSDEGCSPIELTSRIDKGFIIIMATNIEKGARLF
jgi:uncharacterized membrane protein